MSKTINSKTLLFNKGKKIMSGEMKKVNKEKELSLTLTQFFKILYVDFGLNKFNDKIKHWYELSWEEFKKELEDHSVTLKEHMVQDWKDFFYKHKERVKSIKK